MSARPSGHGGASTRPSGRPGGVGEAALTDEDGALLTDEHGAVLTIPDLAMGWAGTAGSRGGATARPGGRP